MTISIITAAYNNATTIKDTITSVCNQTLKPFEHIIIDGVSTDNTLEILKNYPHLKIISEPDKGIYDALNKGIRLAKGDIIGILHADDFYTDSFVLKNVLQAFEKNECDAVYGNLQYVKNTNVHKLVRNWNAGNYERKKIKQGWMPPHPTLFVKKNIYEKFGYFDLNYSIASDYELMVRFLWKHNISLAYIQRVLVSMRTGGKSNKFNNLLKKMHEDYQIIKRHNIGGIEVLIKKNFRKIYQFF